MKQEVYEIIYNRTRSQLQDTINKLNPRLSLEIEIHPEDKVMVVIVPEGTNKPYASPNGFFLRSGPNSQKLDRDSIIEFLQHEEYIQYDRIIRKDLPLYEKFNEKAYKAYIKAAGISEVLDRGDMLVNMGCAGFVGNTLCYTNAGALFFRENEDDIHFRHAAIACGLFKGTDKAYVLDAKEFNSDLISNIDDAVLYLKKHLKLSYKIEGIRRENILELPEKALREAVINAACHRLYSEKGARVMVEVFDDRVEITNPGGACKGITAKNFGKISIARNSVIASMLCRIDYIEQMGTGIERMRTATKDADVAQPEFDLDGFFRVIFKRATSIGNQAGTITGRLPIKTPDRDEIILKFLNDNNTGKASGIAHLLGVSTDRARQILRKMASDGLITKHGDRRHTHYTAK